MSSHPLAARLGSLRWTPWAIALLTAGVLGIHFGGLPPAWSLLPGGVLLAVNLAAGLFVHPALRRNPGLLVFHLGLLAVAVLALGGQLTRFEARIELVEGAAYRPEALMAVRAGPLHGEGWRHLRFVQGPYSVDYAPGLERSDTRSTVLLPEGEGRWRRVEVGDDRPLVLDGYRFYTTWNKGFAVVLSWFPGEGGRMTGAVHLPAYPGMEWKQENEWRVPGSGASLHLRLLLPPRPPEDRPWRLRGERRRDLPLEVSTGDATHRLLPGQSLALAGGRLQYDEVRGWMGYKIYYDPTLPWLFWTALAAVAGLGWHYLRPAWPRRCGSNTMAGKERAYGT